MSMIHWSPQLSARRGLAAAVIGWLGAAVPAHAVLSLFETPGITLGNDAVECTDQGSYRHCTSDAGTERVLSHDGLPDGGAGPECRWGEVFSAGAVSGGPAAL